MKTTAQHIDNYNTQIREVGSAGTHVRTIGTIRRWIDYTVERFTAFDGVGRCLGNYPTPEAARSAVEARCH